MIVKTTQGWFVKSSDGSKKLGGPYRTRKEALVRLREVEYFKKKRAK